VKSSISLLIIKEEQMAIGQIQANIVDAGNSSINLSSTPIQANNFCGRIEIGKSIEINGKIAGGIDDAIIINPEIEIIKIDGITEISSINPSDIIELSGVRIGGIDIEDGNTNHAIINAIATKSRDRNIEGREIEAKLIAFDSMIADISNGTINTKPARLNS
jgi:hypothetical protein